MIKLEPYTLNHVPNYCLYSKTYSTVSGQPKFDIAYLDTNTKFGYWFEKYYKNTLRHTEWFKTKPMHADCCRYVESNCLHLQLKQQRKIQGLKDGKGYKKFLQWMHKEKRFGDTLIWFTSYHYLEQMYEGTLWSNSKNIR